MYTVDRLVLFIFKCMSGCVLGVFKHEISQLYNKIREIAKQNISPGMRAVCRGDDLDFSSVFSRLNRCPNFAQPS